jgi:translocation and assembly module TamA
MRRLGFSIVLALAALATPAHAADPQPYAVTIRPTGDAALDAALHDSATLISLQKKALVGPFALVARARADLARLTTALHSYGYYLGSVAVSIDGLAIDDVALPAKLDAAPASPPVPVVVTPTRNALFHIGRVTLAGDVPPGTQAHLAIKPGDPAQAAPVLAAGVSLQATLRDQGRPLAHVAAPVALLELGSRTLDISYQVSAGPVADIGPIAITGGRRLHESYLRRRLLLHQGQPYDPRKIEAARQDLAAVPALASVRITQPDALDAMGQMPLFVQVAERPLHAVDLGAAYSTDQGGSVTASWTHRDLFGNAEVLVLSASATDLGGTATTQPGYNVGALLTFPDWYARNQSLALNTQALKEDLTAYNRTAALASAIVTRKLDPELSVSAGVSFEQARIEQEGVTRDYSLPQLPLTATYDTTGSLFEPIHGFRATVMLTPTYSLGGATEADGSRQQGSQFLIAQLSGSTYLDFGRALLGEAAGRSILALRGLVGTITGASTFDIPPDQRFYAGGGGTIRGWRYQSVGPTYPDRTPLGGTSIEVGSVEYRQRVLGSYGFAVFVDAGQVGSRGAPFTGADTLRVGAGAGVRYYTSIGPIRVDVAAPLNKDPSIKTDVVEAYIGIGEAF